MKGLLFWTVLMTAVGGYDGRVRAETLLPDTEPTDFATFGTADAVVVVRVIRVSIARQRQSVFEQGTGRSTERLVERVITTVALDRVLAGSVFPANATMVLESRQALPIEVGAMVVVPLARVHGGGYQVKRDRCVVVHNYLEVEAIELWLRLVESLHPRVTDEGDSSRDAVDTQP
jgi:hypothetical protein